MLSSPFVCLFVQEYLMIKAAFLAFGGQLRTTSAEDFHEREREREREKLLLRREEWEVVAMVNATG